MQKYCAVAVIQKNSNFNRQRKHTLVSPKFSILCHLINVYGLASECKKDTQISVGLKYHELGTGQRGIVDVLSAYNADSLGLQTPVIYIKQRLTFSGLLLVSCQRLDIKIIAHTDTISACHSRLLHTPAAQYPTTWVFWVLSLRLH